MRKQAHFLPLPRELWSSLKKLQQYSGKKTIATQKGKRETASFCLYHSIPQASTAWCEDGTPQQEFPLLEKEELDE